MSSQPPPRKIPKELTDSPQAIGFYKELLESLRSASHILGGDVVFVSTVPSSASDSGTKGMIAMDEDYIYRCVDTDTWKRTSLSTW